MKANVIAVIEAIEKMLPPLPPTNKWCPDRYAHKGHPWSIRTGATTFAVVIPLITHETGNDGANANMV